MYNLESSYILTAKEENGELGYTLDNLPECDDETGTITTEGYIIAHDLLDHVTGFENMGSINDEIIAFGAMWFIRGEFDEIRRNNSFYSNSESIAADISRQGLEILVHGSKNFNGNVAITLECDDELFEDIIEEAGKSIIEDWLYDLDMSGYEELTGEQHAAVVNYLCKVRQLLTEGYKLAQERYNNDWITVNDLFFNIASELDSHLKYIDYPGQQLKLSIDQFGSVDVEEYYEEEDEEDYEEAA